MAFVVVYDPYAANGIAAQTRNSLRFLEAKLSEVGSKKDPPLQAKVFLSDKLMKPEMDRISCEWIGSEENWPQRICVGADLGDEVTLIEITAATASSGS